MSEIRMDLGRPEKLTGEIVAGFKMAQEFEAPKSLLKIVGINFATYMRENRCSINVSIKDLEGIVIGYNHLNGRNVVDNAFANIHVNVKLEPGKRYLLVVAGVDGMQGQCITAKLGTSDGLFRFMIGPHKVDGMNLFCNLTFDDYIDPASLPQVIPVVKPILQTKQPTLNDVLAGKVSQHDYQPEPEDTEISAVEQFFKKKA